MAQDLCISRRYPVIFYLERINVIVIKHDNNFSSESPPQSSTTPKILPLTQFSTVSLRAWLKAFSLIVFSRLHFTWRVLTVLLSNAMTISTVSPHSIPPPHQKGCCSLSFSLFSLKFENFCLNHSQLVISHLAEIIAVVIKHNNSFFGESPPQPFPHTKKTAAHSVFLSFLFKLAWKPPL